MKNSELVFIGIKGSVVALNSATGQQAWATPLKGADIVNVVLQHEALLATCAGEIFCLDPFTGKILWHNPLKGFGLGFATIATELNPGNTTAAAAAETQRQAAGAAAAVSASS